MFDFIDFKNDSFEKTIVIKDKRLDDFAGEHLTTIDNNTSVTVLYSTFNFHIPIQFLDDVLKKETVYIRLKFNQVEYELCLLKYEKDYVQYINQICGNNGFPMELHNKIVRYETKCKKVFFNSLIRVC